MTKPRVKVAGNRRELCNEKPFVVIVQKMVLLIPELSVQRKLHGKDQIAIPEDKHDSLSLQVHLWRNNELSEYQKESQLSLTKVSTLQTHIPK